MRGECIFDVSPTSEVQAARQEVRWLFKRRYVRAGEHRFKLSAKGVLTISQGDFSLSIDTNEEEMRVSPPMPGITIAWG